MSIERVLNAGAGGVASFCRANGAALDAPRAVNGREVKIAGVFDVASRQTAGAIDQGNYSWGRSRDARETLPTNYPCTVCVSGNVPPQQRVLVFRVAFALRKV